MNSNLRAISCVERPIGTCADASLQALTPCCRQLRIQGFCPAHCEAGGIGHGKTPKHTESYTPPGPVKPLES